MSWIDSVTNRTQADITNRTSKAFLNVADWQRIYDNALILNGVVAGYVGYTIAFDTIADPTTTTFPTITNLNKLCQNIERIRAALNIFGLFPIRYNWLEGYDKTAPNYTHVNQWELTLETMEQYFVKRKPRTGIAGAGCSLTRNNGFRG